MHVGAFTVKIILSRDGFLLIMCRKHQSGAQSLLMGLRVGNLFGMISVVYTVKFELAEAKNLSSR